MPQRNSTTPKPETRPLTVKGDPIQFTRTRKQYPRPFIYASLRADGTATIPTYSVPLLWYRLRRDIPPSARCYDRHARCWIIAPEWADVALRAFRATFPDGWIDTTRGWV
jgi:hypothetical protein